MLFNSIIYLAQPTMFFCYLFSNGYPLQAFNQTIMPQIEQFPTQFLQTQKNMSQNMYFLPQNSSFLSQKSPQKQILAVIKQQEKPKVKKQTVSKMKQPKYQEYLPKQKPKKKPNMVYQNAKRNVVPNIVHQVLCFIHSRKKSQDVVKKYIEKIKGSQSDHEASVERFYKYQKLFKSKANRYNNEKDLKRLFEFQQPDCQIYSQEEQEVYVKINRILLKYYLQIQLPTSILTSVRMKKQSRVWHLEARRQILSEIEDATICK